MDMKTNLGSFAAALKDKDVWVMNVVPEDGPKTLTIVYDRGLLGTIHNWCEAFSTYPRTYDLIHASGVFSLYKNKCNAEDILLEMDRILRPEGAIIIRDNADVLYKVKRIASGMRWKMKVVDHEEGPRVAQKVLFTVKQYWVAGENSTKPAG